MAIKPVGRGGQVSFPPGGKTVVDIVGITQIIRELAKSDERFKKEANTAAKSVAELLIVAAKFEATTVTRSSQAAEVMKGMKARSFNSLPAAVLSEKSAFVSKSRPNRKRKRKVTRGDVFFGAEFGGGKFGKGTPTVAGRGRKGGGYTSQFLRHRGTAGYFFWPAVTKNKERIAKEYLDAITRVLDKLDT